MDNAAPTVLDTSQLPTRQNKRKTPSQKGLSDKLGTLISQRPQYLSSPFCDIPWSDDSHGSGSGSDEYTAEPIDEQEIFGENSLVCAVSSVPFVSPFPHISSYHHIIKSPCHYGNPVVGEYAG